MHSNIQENANFKKSACYNNDKRELRRQQRSKKILYSFIYEEKSKETRSRKEKEGCTEEKEEGRKAAPLRKNPLITSGFFICPPGPRGRIHIFSISEIARIKLGGVIPLIYGR